VLPKTPRVAVVARHGGRVSELPGQQVAGSVAMWGSVDERVILAIGDSADANARRPEGDRAGTNIVMWLLGNASVRCNVWGGNHGCTKCSGVGL
jgi:hypothetical protein